MVDGGSVLFFCFFLVKYNMRALKNKKEREREKKEEQIENKS